MYFLGDIIPEQELVRELGLEQVVERAEQEQQRVDRPNEHKSNVSIR